LVRVHDSVLMAESKYKCLLISDNTTVNEVISILFHCYGLERIERVDRYELCEVGPEGCYEKRLEPSDCPVSVQATWKTQNQFLLRRSSVPAFKTSSSVMSLSVSTASGGSGSSLANSSKTSESSFLMQSPMETDYESPRSVSSAGSSSISPTGSVMSNISSSSDESTTSTNVSPHPPPLPPPNFSGNRPLPVLPRPPVYPGAASKPLVPNVCPPHMRRTSFHLNSPVTAFPGMQLPSSAPPIPSTAGMSFPAFTAKPTGAIHECGLPTTPSPSSTLVPSSSSEKYNSLQGISGSRTRVAFHHYENYFYI